ncbi:nitroreductase family protein [Geodermatophilus sp. FMUSA9-8]|uniref:nitroreductase family protein n=1 Tax=Geodermatophilus sp. FMUSA9-8 TaxID=3120155 RepID=UPI00300A8A80
MGLTPARQRLGRLKDTWSIARETWEDGRRHAAYAAAVDRRSGLPAGTRQLEAQITKDYHRIEKGLSLRTPRAGFGAAVAARLRRDLPRYAALPGHDPAVLAHGRSALDALALWHAEAQLADDGPTRRPPASAGLDPDEVGALFRSRTSVRDFAPDPLDPALVRRAAELALHSPSVCNRQAWAVWAFHDRLAVERVAALQNGSAGFRESIPCLLVIGVDTRLFAGSAERNQRWVDGGLYAMSLVWALHGLGVATCMLNWSVGHRRTRELRALTGIPDHVDVVTMVAAGLPRAGLRVARSPRRRVDDVLQQGTTAR